MHGRVTVGAEPNVEFHRHRTITTSYSDEPTSRTVIRHYGTWKRIGFYRRHRYGHRVIAPAYYAVRHHRHYVQEPYIVHHRSVRRYETSEPSVSVGFRTTHRSERVGVGGSVEMRTRGARDTSARTEVSAESKGQMTRPMGDKKGGGEQLKMKHPAAHGAEQTPQQ